MGADLLEADLRLGLDFLQVALDLARKAVLQVFGDQVLEAFLGEGAAQGAVVVGRDVLEVHVESVCPHFGRLELQILEELTLNEGLLNSLGHS